MSSKSSSGLLYGIGGLLIGAVLGLLLAPQSGRRTRALVKDKSIKYSHDIVDFAGKKSRHIANKMKGYAHELKDTVTSLTGASKTETREEITI